MSADEPGRADAPAGSKTKYRHTMLIGAMLQRFIQTGTALRHGERQRKHHATGVISMVVVDHEPAGWFLLRDDIGYALDVNCSQSFVSYTAVLRLTPGEAAGIEAYGREAIDKLARAIQYSPSRYADRYGDRTLVAASEAAIERWRDSRPAT